MKYIREYHNYDNSVAEICLKYGIGNWSIRDGLVDIDGDVYLSNKNLSELPLKFGRVSGNFYCRNNKLTTLEGAPESVGGDFYCYENKLTTIEGAPNWVVGNFSCYENKLTTLEGAPNWIGGDLSCFYNQLTTLENFPNVKGKIYINDNPLPKEIYYNKKYLKQIIELQGDYDIWRDGNLYLPRFNQLMLDIKEDKK